MKAKLYDTVVLLEEISGIPHDRGRSRPRRGFVLGWHAGDGTG
jgi:hypothetical protein